MRYTLCYCDHALHEYSDLASVASVPFPVRAERKIGPREGGGDNKKGVTNAKTPSRGTIFRSAGKGTLATLANSDPATMILNNERVRIQVLTFFGY